MSSKIQGPSGVLVIDKAPEMTSHDVVAIARGALGIKKIGHCGTLDPMATGVLMLVINHATKLQDRLMADDKEYEGTLCLGVTTSSYDADGNIEETHPVPELSRAEIDAAFAKYSGAFEQIPPMVSAIKQNGVALHKLARQGQVVERPPRPVVVNAHEVLAVSLPEISFRLHCSKGFYVRSYAHDIGQDLGCGAHLTSLRRTRSGKFDLSRCVTVADLKAGDREALFRSMYSLEDLVPLLSPSK